MLLKARSQESEFTLETLGLIRNDARDDLPEWQTIRVRWSDGTSRHDAVDECLMLQEVEELSGWVRSLDPGMADSVMAFTEPSLQFIYLAAPDVVLVSLWLELVPDVHRATPIVLVFPRTSLHLT